MTEKTQLENLLINAVEMAKIQINCSLPGKVVEYDVSLKKAKVKPLINKRYKKSGDIKEIPVVTGVPVIWPASNDGKSFLHLPLVPGDFGLIHFVDRSIDEWLSGDGKENLPNHKRKHSLSDAIFQPGINPFKKAFSGGDSTNLILGNDNIKFLLDPTGKLSITNSANELITVLVDIVKELQNIIVNTGTGQAIPPFTTNMLALQAKLETFKI